MVDTGNPYVGGETSGSEHSEPEEHDTFRGHRDRGFDPLSLLAGIAAMLTSVFVLTDGASFLPDFDPRWLLAGGAVLAGILMLGASARRRG